MSQPGTLTAYIEAAMRHARYKLLDDGTVFGEIPECPGVWANEEQLEDCRDALRATLEDWLLLGLRLGHRVPPIGDVELADVSTPA